MINIKKLKVLYVEDSLTLRKVTKNMLSKFFDYVDVANDGLEAMELYKNYHEEDNRYYDIVFSDLEMPNMDGFDLSKIIFEFNRDQEIVIISGINDFKRLTDLLNIGVKHFISKPVEEEQLKGVIDDVVSRIRKRELDYNDRQEVLEYNKVLKEREEKNNKLLNDKVKELEEFTSALDAAAIVSKADTRGVITYVNDEFCKVCGYSREELIGKNSNIIKSGNRSRSFYKKLWNTINNKEIYKTLFENRHKDGSIYFIESTIKPIVDVNGELVEFISVSHNMTQLMNSLELTKQAEISKEDFFINISHEMKTPLNSIIGFSSILSNYVKDDEKALLMVSKILETGNDLQNLVESILDLRKLKEKSFVLQEHVFDPSADISKCFEKYKKRAYEKNLEYKINIDDNLPKDLLGDSNRVNQVIGIFIDNAIKFTKSGGKVSINLFYDKYENKLVCEVKDSGIGIEKHNHDKIFGLHQLDAARNRSYEGAGLGLNLASNIIKIMGGNISLKSAINIGSLFIVEIPVKRA